MIKRNIDIAAIKEYINIFPVTALLGARQTGKTTLAIELKCDHYFDLENPRDLAMFDNPLLVMKKLNGLIAIDEIQRKPELFPVLRHLVDSNKNLKFVILGSASRDLIEQGSETLAGRIGLLTRLR